MRYLEKGKDESLVDQEPGLSHPAQAKVVFGHKRVRAAFREFIASGRVPPVWLFSGAKGIGKATLAYECARLALATGLATNERSQSDHQLRVLSHPRLFRLVRKKNNDGKIERNIQINDVRRLGERLHFREEDGKWRVVVLDAFDDLNTYGANALLKLLEEPPPFCLFFLICHRIGLVPATIRSRGRQERLQRLTRTELKDFAAAQAENVVAGTISDDVFAAADGNPMMFYRLSGASGGDFQQLVVFLKRVRDNDLSALDGQLQDKIQEMINGGKVALAWLALEWSVRQRVMQEVENGAPPAKLNHMASLIKRWQDMRADVEDYNLDAKSALIIAFSEYRDAALL